jgi:hypothetical protein
MNREGETMSLPSGTLASEKPPEDDLVVCNGIDGATGGYAVKPMPLGALADIARQQMTLEAGPTRSSTTRSIDFEPELMTAITDLEEMGWGVIFAKGVAPEVRSALQPLLERREAAAGPLFKVFEFDPATDSLRTWLARHDAPPGDRDWDKVPFYLLIVGPPSDIPFEFQYLLDISYAVGRLSFNTAAEYATYARSLIAYEEAQAALAAREIVYWGPRHERDRATALSAEHLLAPLAQGSGAKKPVAVMRRFRAALHAEAGGTKANLLEALHRPAHQLPPAVLFTASHGVGWPSDHPRHRTSQGALLCQDWEPFDPVEPSHYVDGADIDDSARVHGLFAFSFACFSAGTPAMDSFRTARSAPAKRIAEQPFVSPLPQRLLAHPGGAALAVVGHVDRAWGYSIKPALSRPTIEPFRACLDRILRGLPVGLATADFSRRYAVLCADLLANLDSRSATRESSPDRALANAWIERNDAQNYVILGDPAARLRLDRLTP